MFGQIQHLQQNVAANRGIQLSVGPSIDHQCCACGPEDPGQRIDSRNSLSGLVEANRSGRRGRPFRKFPL